METFRTEVIPEKYPWKISYDSYSLFIGSCFTQHIGSRMQDLKFRAEVNPFGVVYNPISVKNSLEILLKSKDFLDSDLNLYNGNWFSFYHHSSFSNPNKELCLKNINNTIHSASQHLLKSEYLFITFGTARIFERIETGEVVSNCHKLPASVFKRRLLTVDEIVNEYTSLLETLVSNNPTLKIIFTISPIRHWKDGAEGNQISKSVLLLAVNQLVSMYDNVFYFPSYEIVMDELRDYRFYAEDMIHLSDVAINYIWEKFSQNIIDKESLIIVPRILKINKALLHTPFDASSKSYLNFVESTLVEIKKLEKEFPVLNFSNEKEKLSQLVKR